MDFFAFENGTNQLQKSQVVDLFLYKFAILSTFILQGVLEIWYLGLPLSIQEAYSTLIGDKIQLEYYQVYSHLRRIGYVVMRHQGR
jgi:tRNA-splicing endonuclease subunit Sen54